MIQIIINSLNKEIIMSLRRQMRKNQSVTTSIADTVSSFSYTVEGIAELLNSTINLMLLKVQASILEERLDQIQMLVDRGIINTESEEYKNLKELIINDYKSNVGLL